VTQCDSNSDLRSSRQVC